jgi:Protein of unknown function (DUF1549)/Protein of unknown function (DUF1553)
MPHFIVVPNRFALLWAILAFTAPAVFCQEVVEVTSADPALSHRHVTQIIDEHVRERWDSNGIRPAEVCSDEIFVRRVYLDLGGRIPTLEERQTFLDDASPDKREKLIHQLVSGEDYVKNMADTFDTLLMGRGNEHDYQERAKHHWRSWLERVFRENRPWDQVASEILIARPQSEADEGALWYLFERKDNHQAIAEAIAPAFFGIRIDCAQCHDHMIANEIEQKHYWGLVAFFNRSKNKHTKHGPRVDESAVGGFSDFANLEGASSPNALTFFQSKLIDEPRPGKDVQEDDRDDLYLPPRIDGELRVPKFSRREKFVSDIVREHPMLARAFVNRIWAMLMGRGLVHPFDQMDSTHEPSHPQLLDALADDFRNSGYDIRRIVLAIANCQAYQLESCRPESVDDPATFAWYLQRPLTAEQFARSMQIGLRGQIADKCTLVNRLRDNLPSVMPETIVTGVNESLFLTNNSAINDFIAESRSPKYLLGRSSQMKSIGDAVNQLSVGLLGRRLDEPETQATLNFLNASLNPESTLDEQASNRLNHVAWAWVTSAEFRFNH